MACPAIITGDQFLLRVIGHIDCQAQFLSSYGYQALGEPGSPAATLMAGLLTLFIALFGIRLLFGPAPGVRDTVYDAIKIGLVLTLAFSWPAFRTVIHDVVLDGPAQIAASILPADYTVANASLPQRLQKVDVSTVRLIETGTGRNSGAFLEGSDTGSTFAGTGLQDDTALGYGRLAFLSGVIASLGLLRLVAALLLALAPFAAGLLLFEQTRGIFAGWLRGLTLALLGTIGVSAVLALQLSILEPWLADALRVRDLGYAIPSAPIELLAINCAFTIVQFAMIWVLAKIAFTRGWITLPNIQSTPSATMPNTHSIHHSGVLGPLYQNRAERISDSVERQIRRERSSEIERLRYRTLDDASRTNDGPARQPSLSSLGNSGAERLGSSYRRSHYRVSQAARKRDRGE